MKIGIALTTKDRVNCAKRAIAPLVSDRFDLFIVDGSKTPEGQAFAKTAPAKDRFLEVFGGPDAAIVFSLSKLLFLGYDFIGFVEQDVLLPPDWFGPTFALFERGLTDGLEVGAVSARAYKDRILFQKDGYAVMHNLGAGMVIFSRRAAEIILWNYRTGNTLENRAIFGALARKDIGTWWAFGAASHPLTADWSFDAILARHGLASLALVPQLAEMLDQDVQSKGLNYANEPVELLRDDKACKAFGTRLFYLRSGFLTLPQGELFSENGSTIVYPHQVSLRLGSYEGSWRYRWCQGFGPFAYVADEGASLTFGGQGTLGVIVGASQFEIIDPNGFKASPEVSQMTSIMVPGGMVSRSISLRALRAGSVFHGVSLRNPVTSGSRQFHWCELPEAE